MLSIPRRFSFSSAGAALFSIKLMKLAGVRSNTSRGDRLMVRPTATHLDQLKDSISLSGGATKVMNCPLSVAFFLCACKYPAAP